METVNKRFEKLTSVSDIVETMVKGLKRKWVEIDMDTFGAIKGQELICYGCAATNTLCELMQKPFPNSEINNRDGRLKIVNYNLELNSLLHFEYAIDALRQGDTHTFIRRLGLLEFNFIIEEPYRYKYELPWLITENWRSNLKYYEHYIIYLREKNL